MTCIRLIGVATKSKLGVFEFRIRASLLMINPGRAALAMAWIPAQDVGGNNSKRSDELRIRASNLNLNGLTGLQPMADKLAPSLGEIWRTTQPSGKNQSSGAGYSLASGGKDPLPG